MLAVRLKPPGANRDQISKRRLDPILCLDRVEADVLRDLVPGGEADQTADCALVCRRNAR